VQKAARACKSDANWKTLLRVRDQKDRSIGCKQRAALNADPVKRREWISAAKSPKDLVLKGTAAEAGLGVDLPYCARGGFLVRPHRGNFAP
jgi:hypothetical protein